MVSLLRVLSFSLAAHGPSELVAHQQDAGSPSQDPSKFEWKGRLESLWRATLKTVPLPNSQACLEGLAESAQAAERMLPGEVGEDPLEYALVQGSLPERGGTSEPSSTTRLPLSLSRTRMDATSTSTGSGRKHWVGRPKSVWARPTRISGPLK